MSFVRPVTLTGQRWVTLEPLQAAHAAEIAAAAADAGNLWFTNVPSPDTAAAWVQTRLGDPAGVTFVVRLLDGTVRATGPPGRRAA